MRTLLASALAHAVASTPAATTAIAAAVCISLVSAMAVAAVCGMFKARKRRAPAPPGWMSIENLARSDDYVPASAGHTQGGGYRPPGFANPLPQPGRPLPPRPSERENNPNGTNQSYGIHWNDPRDWSATAHSEKEVRYSGPMSVRGLSHHECICGRPLKSSTAAVLTEAPCAQGEHVATCCGTVVAVVASVPPTGVGTFMSSCGRWRFQTFATRRRPRTRTSCGPACTAGGARSAGCGAHADGRGRRCVT